MTPNEARAVVRKIVGPPRRRVEGLEHDRLMLMFAMMEPLRETNNQHSWSAEYLVGDRHYEVHYFPGDRPFIDEVEN